MIASYWGQTYLSIPSCGTSNTDIFYDQDTTHTITNSYSGPAESMWVTVSKPTPKAWRWYDVFRVKPEPPVRRYRQPVFQVCRRRQDPTDRVQRRRWKRRKWLHKL